jgi:hypothetical protein
LEISIGATPRATLSWNSTANAVSYEYIIRWAGTDERGSLVESGSTSSTSKILTTTGNNLGVQMMWKVRGINSAGTAGLWSEKRTFYISHPVNAVIKCDSASCPFRGAWYLVSRDLEYSSIPGVPNLMYLDYISASCTGGRTATTVTFENMSGYARSSRYGGCP